MDTQTSVVERVQVTDEQLPSAISWDTLKNDPSARLSVLKKAREAAGAEKLLPALYDQLRLLAASKPPQQEEIKEELVDMLSAFGMELVVPVPTLPVVESSVTASPVPPSAVSVEVTPLADTQNQGFAGPRPTPQFFAPPPAPVAVPMSAPEAIPEVAAPIADTKQQFVADMKAQLSEAHDPYREPILESIARVTEAMPANDAVLPESPEGAPSAEQQEDKTAALTTPEVTKGLEQLLSEWDLFKSSGIFGLGAGGTEHPLYKKLAGLPVMSVLSGRWEGADTKSVTNIKEYMDGWNGQWGIEAEPEESFETYLRRVIAEILRVTRAVPEQAAA